MVGSLQAIASFGRVSVRAAVASAALLVSSVVLPAAAQQATRDARPAYRLLEAFRDCPTCPVMVPLGAGEFQMGSTDDENERERVPPSMREASLPNHRVKIRNAFAIGKYEVTRAEFAEFVADSGYKPQESCFVFAPDRDAPLLTAQPVDRSATFTERTGFSWRNAGFRQANEEPVVCVSWNDAKAYVAWLSTKTRQRYALPSEAEWEYAARAGSTGARYWGEGLQDVCGFANGGDLSLVRMRGVLFERDTPHMPCEDGYGFTAPVGKFKPNAFTLHDMIGNVAEWVEDCWSDNYASAPDDGSAVTLPNCRRYVVRGGSWFNVHGRFLRAANRAQHGADTRVSVTGFRIVRRL
jgi:sulfatase modifying factor 1